MPNEGMNTIANNLREIRNKNIQLAEKNAQLELLRILNDNEVITVQQRAEYARRIMSGTLQTGIKAVA